jgi:hypothetical protein
MIVWGGVRSDVFLGDGAIYDPAADQWVSLPMEGAPSPRGGHVAVWTGQEMLVFGGDTASGAVANGAAFNLATGRWRSLTTGGGPIPRSGAAAAWTGSELVAFGGVSGGQPVAALQRLNPQPTWYLYRKP